MNKAIILLSAVLFLASCGGGKKDLATLKKERAALDTKITEMEKASGKKDSVRSIAVNVESMYPTVFNSYLELQGRVDAGKSVNATPEAPGVVMKIHVTNGQYVKRGQTLATLKAETINSGLAELDQQISFAKIMYDKQKKLWAQEIGTEVQLLTAKNQYESLLKKKNTTRTQRGMYVITSPINGVVDDVNINVGDMANPGMPNTIRIVNTSELKIEVNIPESYAGNVSAGSPAMIILPDANDTMLSNVKYVQKTIDPAKRTFTAEITPRGLGGLRPNMIAEVKISTYQNKRAFVLPIKLVQKINGEELVFTVDKMGKAKLTKVSVGKIYRGMAEIKSGLMLDDKVVTAGYENLNVGDKLSYTK